jgi:hypothetical protein
MGYDLSGQIIGVTGTAPYRANVIRNMIIARGGIIGSAHMWEHEQIIVVGRTHYDRDYLQQSIKLGLKYGFVCRYMSQEAFSDLCHHEVWPYYYHGDPRIKEHAGLSYLAFIGFKWPSTAGGPGDGSLEANGWSRSHPLAYTFGYSVGKDVSIRARREALKLALTSRSMGLQEVVEHIAFLVRINKGRWDDHMEGAIARWEEDLDWLYDTYYKGSIYTFFWPEY